jgi:hypothetical protein
VAAVALNNASQTAYAAAFDAFRHGIAIGLGVTLIQTRSRRANHSQGLLILLSQKVAAQLR